MPSDEKINFPDNEKLPDGANIEPFGEHSDVPQRRRRRIKIRKKIRIKQKPSARKLVRKIAERAFWIIIFAGFIISLILMIVELDVRDDKFKQQRRKVTPVKSQ